MKRAVTLTNIRGLSGAIDRSTHYHNGGQTKRITGNGRRVSKYGVGETEK